MMWIAKRLQQAGDARQAEMYAHISTCHGGKSDMINTHNEQSNLLLS